MDNKIIIAIVAVVVIVVAAAAVLAMSPQQPQPAADSVTYYGNGGTDHGQTTVSSKLETVLPYFYERDGYHMVSWNTKADGSGTAYYPDDPVAFGTALYAQWSDGNTISTINMFTSVFNLFLGSKGSSDVVSFDSGSKDLAATGAILVIKPVNTSDKMSLSEDGWIIIESGKTKNQVKFNIEGEGVTLGSISVLETTFPAMYIDLNQTGKNHQVSLEINFEQNTPN